MRALAVLAAAALVLGACSSGGGTTTNHDVPVVVPGPASAWSAVTVNGAGQSKDMPADAKDTLAPLRAARALEQPGALSEYGLDHPRATLTYRPASSGAPEAEVDVGNANFDRHFVYVQRRGSPSVYLVPADILRAALAMVGIEDKAPDD